MVPILILSFAAAQPSAADAATWRAVQAELDRAYGQGNAPVVRVEDDVAWVSGRVASPIERDWVLGLVRAEAPHLTIDDGLTVGPPTPVEDRLAEDLITRQLEDLDVDERIDVEVADGLARVEGQVASQGEARVVHALAASAPEVGAAVTAVSVERMEGSEDHLRAQAIRQAVFWSGAECIGLDVDVLDTAARVRCSVPERGDIRRIRRELARRDLRDVELDIRVR